MPHEIEAKLKVPSHEPVRRRLREVGAERLGAAVETNVILDRGDGSLRKQGCGLRVRSARSVDGPGTVATLTFKGPRQPGALKIREEIEVEVADGERLLNLMKALGLVEVLWYQKRRESWRMSGCRVELDEPPHLGLFVEIEGPSESAVFAARAELGLEHTELVHASYVSMLVSYCEREGISDRRLRLPGP
jgi:adenylate cyclase class 2